MLGAILDDIVGSVYNDMHDYEYFDQHWRRIPSLREQWPSVPIVFPLFS